jgi:hypothetical protein
LCNAIEVDFAQMPGTQNANFLHVAASLGAKFKPQKLVATIWPRITFEP